MIEYELKIYVELASILLKERIDRNTFLREFQLSDYEYNKHIKLLAELANTIGVKISDIDGCISYKANDNFEKLKKSYVSFYYANKDYYDENVLLSAIISEYLIWNDGRYVTLDEIADVIGYSKSKLREAIKQARISLNENNIKVENVSHHGLKIYAKNEFYFRTCLVSLYAVFSWMNIINVGDETNYIYFGIDSYSKIIDAIDAVAKNSNVYLLKSERKKIAYSLIVQQQRINKGKLLNDLDGFEMDLINEVDLNESLELLTNKLIGNLSSNCLFQYPNEYERLYVKLIIFGCTMSIEASKDIINKLYLEEHSKLYELIISHFANEYNLDFSDEVKNDMKIALNLIVVKYHIHLLTKKGSAINGKNRLSKQSPLLAKMLNELTDIIGEFYRINIPCSQLSDLAEILNIDISNRVINYRKPNIGITSRNSTFEPLLIYNLIQYKCNPNLYSKLEMIDFEKIYPENRKLLSNYDLIFCDQALSNCSKLVEYRNNNVNIKYFKDKISQFGNYYDYYFSESPIKKDLSIEEFKKLIGNDFNCEVNNISFCIKVDDSKLTLQIGNIKPDVKCKSYVYLRGKISENNIGFIYNLLFQTATDFMLFDSLYHGNIKEEINNLFNETIA